MINKKLIALDIDGTLLNSEHIVMPLTKETLISLQEQGVGIVLVSGRNVYSLVEIGNKIHLSNYEQNGYISLNGLELYDINKNCLHKEETLQKSDAQVLINIAKQYDMDTVLFFEKHIFVIDNVNSGIINNYVLHMPVEIVKSIDDIPEHEFDDLKKVVFIQDEKVIAQHYSTVYEKVSRDYEIAMIETDWLEMNPYGCHKGKSLEKYVELLGLTMDDVIAFGNGGNDVSMLEKAGLGIAMGNAFDYVKEVADDVCEDCDHDGIGKYLRKLMEV